METIERLLTLFLFHFPWLLSNSNEKLVKLGLTVLPLGILWRQTLLLFLDGVMLLEGKERSG
jgi:hypothetical protein